MLLSLDHLFSVNMEDKVNYFLGTGGATSMCRKEVRPPSLPEAPLPEQWPL